MGQLLLVRSWRRQRQWLCLDDLAASLNSSPWQAQAELVRLSGEAIKGVYIDASGETMSHFLDRSDRDWPAIMSHRKPRSYRQLIANHIKPHLGATPVPSRRFTSTHPTAHFLRWGGIDGEPLAALTVGHVHRLLRRIFGHAAQWGIIAQNPAALVHPLRVQQGEIEIIREDEIRLVRVEQSLEQTKAGLRFKPPKSKHGRRSITILPAVVADLRAHWKAAQEQRLALGIGGGTSTDLVFTMWDGSPRKPNALTNDWLRASVVTGGESICMPCGTRTHQA